MKNSEDLGWTLLAKAIVANSGGLGKYIEFAQKWKKKEEEWKTLPFIKTKVLHGKRKSRIRERSNSNTGSEHSEKHHKYDKLKKTKNINHKGSHLTPLGSNLVTPPIFPMSTIQTESIAVNSPENKVIEKFLLSLRY